MISYGNELETPLTRLGELLKSSGVVYLSWSDRDPDGFFIQHNFNAHHSMHKAKDIN